MCESTGVHVTASEKGSSIGFSVIFVSGEAKQRPASRDHGHSSHGSWRTLLQACLQGPLACAQGLVTPPAHMYTRIYICETKFVCINIDIQIDIWNTTSIALQCSQACAMALSFKSLLRNLPDNWTIVLGMVLLRCCPGLLLGSCFAGCQVCLFVV